MPTYIEKYCKTHGLTKQRLVNYKEGARYRCVKCDVIYQSEGRRKIKIRSIDYKGGKCEKCGYDKCIDALEFHHIDPTKKEFELSGKKLKWDTLQAELDKCILVCANCHREIHAKENT